MTDKDTRLERAFDNYIEEVYANVEGGLPEDQQIELEMAWFAGAYTLLDELHNIRADNDDKEQTGSYRALVDELMRKCLLFMEDVGEETTN